MRVRDLIAFLEEYDGDEEVQVEACFSECGEVYSSTFDVTTFSHEEIESGRANPYPTILAGIGFGDMSHEEMGRLIEYVKGVGERLCYYRK